MKDLLKIAESHGLSFRYYLAEAKSIVRELEKETQSVVYIREKIRHVEELLELKMYKRE